MPLDRPPTVRIATQADERPLYSLLVDLYKDNWLGESMSERKVWERINNACHHQGGIAGVIDGPDGKIIGSIGIFFGESWYSEDIRLEELWLFVHPNHRRGTPHGDDLFDFGRWYQSKMVNSTTGRTLNLITSVSSWKRLPAKLRWWQRRSRQVGGIFVIEDGS